MKISQREREREVTSHEVNSSVFLKEYNYKLSELENDTNFSIQEYVNSLFEKKIQSFNLMNEKGEGCLKNEL